MATVDIRDCAPDGTCCQISSRPARIIVVRVDITDLKETCVI